MEESVCLERLLDEIISAPTNCGDGCFNVSVTTDDDDRNQWIDRFEILQKRQAIHVAALQPDIEDYQARCPHPDFFERLFGGRSTTDGVVLILQNARNELPDIRFVVDD